MRLNKFSMPALSWVREGHYLLFYLLAVVCFMYPIEYLHIDLKYSTIISLPTLLVRGWPVGDTLLNFLPTVGDAFLLALPLFLFTRRRWVVFIPLFLFDIFCLIQTCYARVYEDVMPYSSFLLFDNVNDVLLNSVRGLLRWRDVTLFLPTLMLLGGYLLYFRRMQTYPSQRTRVVAASISLVIVLMAYGTRAYGIYHREPSDRESPWTAFITPYNYREYVLYHGVVPYTGYVLVSSIVQSDELSESELSTVANYLDGIPRYTDNRYAVEPGRNLILIVVESMNSFGGKYGVGGGEGDDHVPSAGAGGNLLGASSDTSGKRRSLERRASHVQYRASACTGRGYVGTPWREPLSSLGACLETEGLPHPQYRV